MQACKLSIAGTHPSKVVKVWLDPISESIALMLTDSSCLIYTSPLASPTSVPPPSSDGTFLRLQPSKPRGRKHALAGPQRDRDREPRGSRDGRLVFVSAMPDRGGARTVLRAWARQGQVFSPAIVQCGDVRRPRDPGRQASPAGCTIDLAHGFAVRIAASVNVFVVYSPSACKIWVMAAKLARGADEGSAEFNAAGKERRGKENLVCLDFLKCSVVDCSGPVYSIRLSLQHLILGEVNGVRVWPLRPLVKGDQRKPTQDKFALIEKNREEVFVLAKGGKNAALDPADLPSNSVENCRSDAKETGLRNSSKPGNLQIIEGRESVTVSALKMGNLRNDSREMILTVLKPGMMIQTDRGTVMAIDSKGVECTEDCTRTNDRRRYLERGIKNSSEKSNGSGGGLPLKRIPKNGVIENANGNIVQKSEIELRLSATGICCNGAGFDAIQSESLQQGILPLAGKGSLDAVESCADRSGCNPTNVAAICTGVVQGSKLFSNGTTDTCLEASGSFGNLVNSTFNECEANLAISRRRNGQLCSNGTVVDGWYNQQQLSQLSSSASSSSSGSPAAFTSFSVPASSSCSSSVASGTTHPAEATVRVPVTSLSTNSKVSLKVRETLGMASSYFMPFKGVIQESNNWVQGIGKSLRAVSIHALCETKFVVLDSNGDLHLLSLRKPNFAVEDRKEQDGIFSRDNGLRRLNCTMKVKMMAVFPGVSAFTSKRLWVSDGFHSIHVLAFPEVDTSVCESDGDVGGEKLLNLSVVQVVFLSDRVHAIAAMSVNAALVLTQGSIIAYSIAGT